jgi:undecaprenyl diphosphate synthase
MTIIAPMSHKIKSSKFLPGEVEKLDRSRIPQHIAIIPDGNRRWAKKRFLDLKMGHEEGADILMEIVESAQELGVKALTVYGFSTENWNRPFYEVMLLMTLFTDYLIRHQQRMVNNGIKMETIGDLTSLPTGLKDAIHATREATGACDDIRLIFAFNYGSRNEICRAFHKLLEDYDKKKIEKKEIDETTISRYLDTHEWGDPELLIRTSGELRISNFLLWQISYAEIHIAPVLWPDFRPKNLLDAIIDFQNRERRWGGA